jgi:4-amino-4-deoxy-L-arabinose transferase-like glycosyltransferase
MSPKRLVVVAGVALALRLACVAWSTSGWYVLPQDTLTATYFAEGYALAAGEGYVVKDARGSRPELLHPPGMAMLVAALHLITGGPADVAAPLVGALLDTCAAVLLAWLVSVMLGLGAGTVAGLAYALWPPAIWAATGARGPEGLMPIFVLGSLACAFHAASRSGSRAVLWGAAAGVLVGIGSYLRPDYLLLPMALGAGVWAWTRRPLRALSTAALAQAVALLLLAPWAWRNHEISGRWIFTSTSVGATLITGLGEFHNVWGFGYTDEDRAREAAAQGIDSPWSPEADAYFRNVFREAVTQHPGAYVGAVLKRIPLAVAAPQSFGFANPEKTETFAAARSAGKDRFDVLRERTWHVVAAYWDVLLVAGLNLLGAASCAWMLAAGGNRGVAFLLLCPHLYGIGTHLLTHMEPRLILPSAFVLTAAIGWAVARVGSLVPIPAGRSAPTPSGVGVSQ